MKILVVEDERQLSDVLVDLLKQQQYAVDAVYDGETGEEHALTGVYDVILLDVMLPGKSGLELLRSIRRQKIATPVLLLTARSEVDDKISGLDCGADDYLTKPFHSGELLARIRAMTRRQEEFTGDILSFLDISLDKNTHILSGHENTVKLSSKEYQIMEMLLVNSRQIIPKERLIEKIWGFESEAEYNAIEVYISFIRRKLSAIESRVLIKAIRGVGYCLEEER